MKVEETIWDEAEAAVEIAVKDAIQCQIWDNVETVVRYAVEGELQHHVVDTLYEYKHN